MLKLGRQHKDRIWAVEGCNGIGKHIAQRLVADGEIVMDVPAKLSARARVFDTGQGRKTDPVDAHSVAVAPLRSKGLRQVVVDGATVALRLLVDRRDGLGRAAGQGVNDRGVNVAVGVEVERAQGGVPSVDHGVELLERLDLGDGDEVVAAEPADLPFDTALLVSSLDAWLAVERIDRLVRTERRPLAVSTRCRANPRTWATAAFKLS